MPEGVLEELGVWLVERPLLRVVVAVPEREAVGVTEGVTVLLGVSELVLDLVLVTVGDLDGVPVDVPERVFVGVPDLEAV